MELEHIRELANVLLTAESESLVESSEQGVHPKLVLIGRDDHIDIVAIEGAVMNSHLLKGILSHQLRQLARQRNAVAACFFSDVYCAHLNDPAAIEMVDNLHLNLEQACQLGLSTRREALLMQVESPLGVLILRQFYRRENGAVVLEERDQDEVDPTMLQGKFVNLLPKQEMGRA